MTKPPYLSRWTAGSQVGDRAVAAGYFRGVNLNNGNSNYNHQDNHNHALAVRAGECHDSIPFSALYTAYRRARRGKKPSWDQYGFDATWLDQLLNLKEQLSAYQWRPGAPTCRIVEDPKHRQIHAPPFIDRIVHHAVIPPLEAEYEPTFIHDSYSNRCGKGLHAAVRRLQQFVRQVDSGQGGGWYLQLDIKNFFNTIHRPTLWSMIKPRMARAGMPEWMQRAIHALLNYPLSRTGVRWACTVAQRESVPAHKRLENAAPGCGIAIGNYSSQAFANIYMNPLDQYVKHVLKVPRYLRYVDDVLLVHHDREQLETWRVQIQQFLGKELRLELKADQRLRPLRDGIDFLGYIVRPSHALVRRRVVSHLVNRLSEFQHRNDLSPAALQRLRSVWASYLGHFSHAAHWRLCVSINSRFPWLRGALDAKDAQP